MSCPNLDCPFHELFLPNSCARDNDLQCLITDAVKQVSFDSEEVLFNKGQSSSSIYALEKGVVKICSTTSEGREQIVGITSPGNLLVGLQSISDRHYHYSAVAATPVNACKIAHRALLKKVSSDTELSMRLITALNAQLGHSRELMRAMSQKNASAKIASFILLMAPQRKHESVRFTLPLSRMEIANLIGLSEETVCRQMARMKRDDIIYAPRGRIEVRDWPRLKAVAEGAALNGKVVGPRGLEPRTKRLRVSCSTN